MTDKELKEIREKIACPQFGDDHYGEWGALTLQQRKTILKLLDYVNRVKNETIYEITEVLKLEIREALKNNHDAKVERIDHLIKRGIKHNDEFCYVIDGKISALRGIYDFIDELVEERMGVKH